MINDHSRSSLKCFIYSYSFFTVVSETDSEHAFPSSQVKKGQTTEKKAVNSAQPSSSEEQIRFVVAFKFF